jgi:hypothetical protein
MMAAQEDEDWNGANRRNRQNVMVVMNDVMMKLIAGLMGCAVLLLGWLCASTMQLREQMSAVLVQNSNNSSRFDLIVKRLDKHEQDDLVQDGRISALEIQMAETRGMTKQQPGSVAETLNKIYATAKENGRRIDNLEKTK